MEDPDRPGIPPRDGHHLDQRPQRVGLETSESLGPPLDADGSSTNINHYGAKPYQPMTCLVNAGAPNAPTSPSLQTKPGNPELGASALSPSLSPPRAQSARPPVTSSGAIPSSAQSPSTFLPMVGGTPPLASTCEIAPGSPQPGSVLVPSPHSSQPTSPLRVQGASLPVINSGTIPSTVPAPSAVSQMVCATPPLPSTCGIAPGPLLPGSDLVSPPHFLFVSPAQSDVSSEHSQASPGKGSIQVTTTTYVVDTAPALLAHAPDASVGGGDPQMAGKATDSPSVLAYSPVSQPVSPVPRSGENLSVHNPSSPAASLDTLPDIFPRGEAAACQPASIPVADTHASCSLLPVNRSLSGHPRASAHTCAHLPADRPTLSSASTCESSGTTSSRASPPVDSVPLGPNSPSLNPLPLSDAFIGPAGDIAVEGYVQKPVMGPALGSRGHLGIRTDGRMSQFTPTGVHPNTVPALSRASPSLSHPPTPEVMCAYGAGYSHASYPLSRPVVEGVSEGALTPGLGVHPPVVNDLGASLPARGALESNLGDGNSSGLVPRWTEMLPAVPTPCSHSHEPRDVCTASDDASHSESSANLRLEDSDLHPCQTPCYTWQQLQRMPEERYDTHDEIAAHGGYIGGYSTLVSTSPSSGDLTSMDVVGSTAIVAFSPASSPSPPADPAPVVPRPRSTSRSAKAGHEPYSARSAAKGGYALRLRGSKKDPIVLDGPARRSDASEGSQPSAVKPSWRKRSREPSSAVPPPDDAAQRLDVAVSNSIRVDRVLRGAYVLWFDAIREAHMPFRGVMEAGAERRLDTCVGQDRLRQHECPDKHGTMQKKRGEACYALLSRSADEGAVAGSGMRLWPSRRQGETMSMIETLYVSPSARGGKLWAPLLTRMLAMTPALVEVALGEGLINNKHMSHVWAACGFALEGEGKFLPLSPQVMLANLSQVVSRSRTPVVDLETRPFDLDSARNRLESTLSRHENQNHHIFHLRNRLESALSRHENQNPIHLKTSWRVAREASVAAVLRDELRQLGPRPSERSIDTHELMIDDSSPGGAVSESDASTDASVESQTLFWQSAPQQQFDIESHLTSTDLNKRVLTSVIERLESVARFGPGHDMESVEVWAPFALGRLVFESLRELASAYHSESAEYLTRSSHFSTNYSLNVQYDLDRIIQLGLEAGLGYWRCPYLAVLVDELLADDPQGSAPSACLVCTTQPAPCACDNCWAQPAPCACDNCWTVDQSYDPPFDSDDSDNVSMNESSESSEELYVDLMEVTASHLDSVSVGPKPGEVRSTSDPEEAEASVEPGPDFASPSVNGSDVSPSDPGREWTVDEVVEAATGLLDEEDIPAATAVAMCLESLLRHTASVIPSLDGSDASPSTLSSPSALSPSSSSSVSAEVYLEPPEIMVKRVVCSDYPSVAADEATSEGERRVCDHEDPESHGLERNRRTMPYATPHGVSQPTCRAVLYLNGVAKACAGANVWKSRSNLYAVVETLSLSGYSSPDLTGYPLWLPLFCQMLQMMPYVSTLELGPCLAENLDMVEAWLALGFIRKPRTQRFLPLARERLGRNLIELVGKMPFQVDIDRLFVPFHPSQWSEQAIIELGIKGDTSPNLDEYPKPIAEAKKRLADVAEKHRIASDRRAHKAGILHCNAARQAERDKTTAYLAGVALEQSQEDLPADCPPSAPPSPPGSEYSFDARDAETDWPPSAPPSPPGSESSFDGENVEMPLELDLDDHGSFRANTPEATAVSPSSCLPEHIDVVPMEAEPIGPTLSLTEEYTQWLESDGSSGPLPATDRSTKVIHVVVLHGNVLGPMSIRQKGAEGLQAVLGGGRPPIPDRLAVLFCPEYLPLVLRQSEGISAAWREHFPEEQRYLRFDTIAPAIDYWKHTLLYRPQLAYNSVLPGADRLPLDVPLAMARSHQTRLFLCARVDQGLIQYDHTRSCDPIRHGPITTDADSFVRSRIAGKVIMDAERLSTYVPSLGRMSLDSSVFILKGHVVPSRPLTDLTTLDMLGEDADASVGPVWAGLEHMDMLLPRLYGKGWGLIGRDDDYRYGVSAEDIFSYFVSQETALDTIEDRHHMVYSEGEQHAHVQVYLSMFKSPIRMSPDVASGDNLGLAQHRLLPVGMLIAADLSRYVSGMIRLQSLYRKILARRALRVAVAASNHIRGAAVDFKSRRALRVASAVGGDLQHGGGDALRFKAMTLRAGSNLAPNGDPQRLLTVRLTCQLGDLRDVNGAYRQDLVVVIEAETGLVLCGYKKFCNAFDLSGSVDLISPYLEFLGGPRSWGDASSLHSVIRHLGDCLPHTELLAAICRELSHPRCTVVESLQPFTTIHNERHFYTVHAVVLPRRVIHATGSSRSPSWQDGRLQITDGDAQGLSMVCLRPLDGLRASRIPSDENSGSHSHISPDHHSPIVGVVEAAVASAVHLYTECNLSNPDHRPVPTLPPASRFMLGQSSDPVDMPKTSDTVNELESLQRRTAHQSSLLAAARTDLAAKVDELERVQQCLSRLEESARCTAEELQATRHRSELHEANSAIADESHRADEAEIAAKSEKIDNLTAVCVQVSSSAESTKRQLATVTQKLSEQQCEASTAKEALAASQAELDAVMATDEGTTYQQLQASGVSLSLAESKNQRMVSTLTDMKSKLESLAKALRSEVIKGEQLVLEATIAKSTLVDTQALLEASNGDLNKLALSAKRQEREHREFANSHAALSPQIAQLAATRTVQAETMVKRHEAVISMLKTDAKVNNAKVTTAEKNLVTSEGGKRKLEEENRQLQAQLSAIATDDLAECAKDRATVHRLTEENGAMTKERNLLLETLAQSTSIAHAAESRSLEAQGERDMVQQKFDESQGQYDRLDDEHSDMCKSADNYSAQVHTLRGEVERITKSSNKRNSELHDRVVSLERELVIWKSRELEVEHGVEVDVLKERMQELEDDKLSLLQQLDHSSVKFDALSRRHEYSKECLEITSNALQQQREKPDVDLEAEVSRLNGMLATLTTEVEASRERAYTDSQNIEKLEEQLEAAQGSYELLQEDAQRSSDSLDSTRRQILSLKSALESKAQEITRLELRNRNVVKEKLELVNSHAEVERQLAEERAKSQSHWLQQDESSSEAHTPSVGGSPSAPAASADLELRYSDDSPEPSRVSTPSQAIVSSTSLHTPAGTSVQTSSGEKTVCLPLKRSRPPSNLTNSSVQKPDDPVCLLAIGGAAAAASRQVQSLRTDIVRAAGVEMSYECPQLPLSPGERVRLTASLVLLDADLGSNFEVKDPDVMYSALRWHSEKPGNLGYTVFTSELLLTYAESKSVTTEQMNLLSNGAIEAWVEGHGDPALVTATEGAEVLASARKLLKILHSKPSAIYLHSTSGSPATFAQTTSNSTQEDHYFFVVRAAMLPTYSTVLGRMESRLTGMYAGLRDVGESLDVSTVSFTLDLLSYENYMCENWSPSDLAFKVWIKGFRFAPTPGAPEALTSRVPFNPGGDGSGSGSSADSSKPSPNGGSSGGVDKTKPDDGAHGNSQDTSSSKSPSKSPRVRSTTPPDDDDEGDGEESIDDEHDSDSSDDSSDSDSDSKPRPKSGKKSSGKSKLSSTEKRQKTLEDRQKMNWGMESAVGEHYSTLPKVQRDAIEALPEPMRTYVIDCCNRDYCKAADRAGHRLFPNCTWSTPSGKNLNYAVEKAEKLSLTANSPYACEKALFDASITKRAEAYKQWIRKSVKPLRREIKNKAMNAYHIIQILTDVADKTAQSCHTYSADSSGIHRRTIEQFEDCKGFWALFDSSLDHTYAGVSTLDQSILLDLYFYLIELDVCPANSEVYVNRFQYWMWPRGDSFHLAAIGFEEQAVANQKDMGGASVPDITHFSDDLLHRACNMFATRIGLNIGHRHYDTDRLSARCKTEMDKVWDEYCLDKTQKQLLLKMRPTAMALNAFKYILAECEIEAGKKGNYVPIINCHDDGRAFTKVEIEAAASKRSRKAPADDGRRPTAPATPWRSSGEEREQRGNGERLGKMHQQTRDRLELARQHKPDSVFNELAKTHAIRALENIDRIQMVLKSNDDLSSQEKKGYEQELSWTSNRVSSIAFQNAKGADRTYPGPKSGQEGGGKGAHGGKGSDRFGGGGRESTPYKLGSGPGASKGGVDGQKAAQYTPDNLSPDLTAFYKASKVNELAAQQLYDCGDCTPSEKEELAITSPESQWQVGGRPSFWSHRGIVRSTEYKAGEQPSGSNNDTYWGPKACPYCAHSPDAPGGALPLGRSRFQYKPDSAFGARHLPRVCPGRRLTFLYCKEPRVRKCLEAHSKDADGKSTQQFLPEDVVVPPLR